MKNNENEYFCTQLISKTTYSHITMERLLQMAFRPFLFLNRYPILYKGKNFQFVNFGTLMVLSIFFSNTLWLFYLNAKGIELKHHLAIPVGILFVSMVFFTKFFSVFIIGTDFFKRPLHYINQTTMYNQGGILGGIVGVIIIWLMEDINLVILMDAVCYGSAFGLFIGRLACFNYGCCYGQPTNKNLCVSYKHTQSKVLRDNPDFQNKALYPTQLIEAFFNLTIFAILSLQMKLSNYNGVIFIVFFFSYNLFRFLNQQKRATAKVNTLTITALVYTLIGASVLILSFFLGELYYSQTPFTKSMGIVPFLKYLINTNGLFLFMGLISVVTFIFYGLHGRKLGQYFGG